MLTDKKRTALLDLRRKLGELINDNTGEPRYLAMVEKMKAKGLHVFHVIESDYILGGADKVHMVSYCYISESDDLDSVKEFMGSFTDGYCYANVVNDDWGITELGEICFNIRNRMMKRVG